MGWYVLFLNWVFMFSNSNYYYNIFLILILFIFIVNNTAKAEYAINFSNTFQFKHKMRNMYKLN